MSQAEIKTKLSADGSELTRALQQGITKAADFKSQMSGIGKSIGAAFTVAAVVQGLKSLGNEQLATIEKFKQLEIEADAFIKKLENLNEKVQNAESFRGINKALLDYKQALREVSIELDALAQKEEAGGIAGIINFAGDVFESAASGNAFSSDEIRLNALEQQQERIVAAREKALRVAEQRRAALRSQQRAALEEFDVARIVDSAIETGNLPSMKAFLDAAKETERQLRNTFKYNPDAGILEQIKEAVSMSDKLATGINRAGEEAAKAAQSMASFVMLLDSNMQNVQRESNRRLIEDTRRAGEELINFISVVRDGESSMIADAANKLREESQSMFNFLMAFNQAAPNTRQFGASDLRRMGANELGAGNRVLRQADPGQQAMIEWAKKQFMATNQLPDKVASALQNFFGVFIR